MLLNEIISQENAKMDDLAQYFKTVDMSHVTHRELDKITNRFGLVVFKLQCFSEVYKIVIERETSKRFQKWTIAVGVMTILYTIMTFLLFFK